MTKSVVSALVGIAVERGEIGSVDDPVAGYVVPAVGEMGDGKREITFRHLLTMTGGFEWDETGGFGSYSEWIRSRDHLRFLLDRPLAHQPGAPLHLQLAAVHLLGVAVEFATGMPLPAFAQEAIFRPIGIAIGRWESLPGGYVNGGAGLDLRPRDLARLGQLYLQRGASGRRQVLPEEWVDASVDPHFQWRDDSGPLAGYPTGTSGGSCRGPGAPLLRLGLRRPVRLRSPPAELGSRRHQRLAAAPAGTEAPSTTSGRTMRVVVDHLLPAFR